MTMWADDGCAKSIAEPHLRRSSHNPKSDDLKLAATVTSKIEVGNFRAAIRLICSEDKPAPSTADTYEALKKKHPPAPDDRREPCDPTGNSRFQALQVSLEDITKSLKTFPTGSSGGPDGITLRHILDMLAGTKMMNENNAQEIQVIKIIIIINNNNNNNNNNNSSRNGGPVGRF